MREKDIAPEERISYAVDMVRLAKGEVFGDSDTVQPIFKIEKM